MNEFSEIAKQMGRKGGSTTSEKYGVEHYRLMNKKSAETKRKKKLKLAKVAVDNLPLTSDSKDDKLAI